MVTKRSELVASVKSAERLLEEARQALAEFKELTPAQRLAEDLHKAFCHYNHTDGCGWLYEDWSNPGYSRKTYLGKAQAILRVVDLETAQKVISYL